jgi:hypothetical protein
MLNWPIASYLHHRNSSKKLYYMYVYIYVVPMIDRSRGHPGPKINTIRVRAGRNSYMYIHVPRLLHVDLYYGTYM